MAPSQSALGSLLRGDEDGEGGLINAARAWWAGITLWHLFVFCLAGAAFGMSIYAVDWIDSDDRLGDLENKTSGLSHHATVPGSHPGKDDINVKRDAYIARDLIVAGTAYVLNGFSSASGGFAGNSTISTAYGNVTALRGHVNAKCLNEIVNFTVDPTLAGGVSRMDVVGTVGPYLQVGWTDSSNDQAVSDTAGTSASTQQNILTIALSTTREVNFYIDNANILKWQLVAVDENTRVRLYYTAYDVDVSGDAYVAARTFVAQPLVGDNSRFMVSYLDPTAELELEVNGITITDASAYPAVTFVRGTRAAIHTASVAVAPCVSVFKPLYVGGTTYVLGFSDDSGIQERAFSVSVVANAWTFTFGAALSISNVGAADRNKCFLISFDTVYAPSSSATGYIGTSYGGGTSSTDIRTDLVTSAALVLTKAGSTKTILSGVLSTTARHEVVALAGGTQYGVGLQSADNLIIGELTTFTVNTVANTIAFVDANQLPTITWSAYEGYFVNLFGNPLFDIISIGGNSTYQQIVICYQTPISENSRTYCERFTLNAGVRSGASNPVVASSYLATALSVAHINDTTFSVLYQAQANPNLTPLRMEIITVTADDQLQVSTRPGFPIGLALNDADPGAVVQVLLQGCFSDPLFEFEGSVQMCMHGNGVLAPDGYFNAGVDTTYSPVCACTYVGGYVRCRFPGYRSGRTPYGDQF